MWRILLTISPAVVGPVSRVEVSGDVPEELRAGPLILAANHLSPFDPFAFTAACHARRLAPRIMATGGLFEAPVVGPVMRRSGHIRVDRRTATVAQALSVGVDALAQRCVVAVYPEGRMGLDPQMWPERGKTGVARLALASGAPVVPVAIWGAHAVLPYAIPKGLVRALLRALVRRPVVRVHFGPPVDLSGLSSGRAGDAVRATDRILEAITAALLVLRAGELDRPRYVDPTRPTDGSRVRRPARPGQHGSPPVPHQQRRSPVTDQHRSQPATGEDPHPGPLG
jgi:1-acyl-sn-glycerol-3-phosphate acyltransferase